MMHRNLGMRTAAWIALALLPIGLMTGCLGDRVAGGATETGNTTTLSGMVRDSLGHGVARVAVHLYPEAYNPFNPESGSLKDSTLTDSAGGYKLEIRNPGRFNLAFLHSSAKTCAFIRGIEVNALRKGSNHIAPEANLRHPGRISIPVKALPADANGYVFIPGSDYSASLAKPGSDSNAIALEGIPPGRYSDLEYVSKDGYTTSNLLAAPIIVRENEETVVSLYYEWNHARRISIDPSASGIGLSEDVLNFPLLIRLETGNFDFSQSAPNGADIRLAKADGTPLPFEIEFWDAVQSRAALWVRIDTLRAKRPGAYVMLHWGNSGASSLSRPAAVFDPASGFEGAWHLHLEPGATPSKYTNASVPANPMMVVAPAGVVQTPSPLFQGILLDGKQGKLASAKPGRAPQTFCISLWFQASGPGKLIGFETNPLAGDPGPFDRHIWIEQDGSLRFGVYEADPPDTADTFERTVSSPPGYMDGAWHFAVASQSPDSGQSLSVDGKLVGRNANVKHAEDISGNWVLGAGKLQAWSPTLTFPYFSGSLDEARVIHALRSQDWIKLSFENQKSGSVFPVLAP